MPLPHRQPGLYDPSFEHDACGVAFVARLDAIPSHETVERALVALANLEHRGAAGADKDTGDGAGILVQIPDAFFRREIRGLPPASGRASETAARRSRPRSSRKASGSSAGATSPSTTRMSVAPRARRCRASASSS
jgi:glutamate synthase domain-containing protein 1